LQNDVVPLPARELQSLLKRAATNGEGRGYDSIKLMLDWDCAFTEDSAEGTLYELWLQELRDALSARIIPAEAQKAAGKLSTARIVEEMSKARASVFGQNPEAARDLLLVETLNAAEVKLVAKVGVDRRNWAWGEVHRAWFIHPLGGISPEAKALFDLGPVTRPGENSTVDATYFGGGSFNQLSGASYREIFDLSDWDKGVGVNVPGQSGQPGSVHYDDLLPLWAHGKYFPLSYSKHAVDRETTDVLELKP
jgi:penicillin amidase